MRVNDIYSCAVASANGSLSVGINWNLVGAENNLERVLFLIEFTKEMALLFTNVNDNSEAISFRYAYDTNDRDDRVESNNTDKDVATISKETIVRAGEELFRQ